MSAHRSHSVLAVLALALGLLATAGAPAAAAPPPEDVCGVCDSHFESAVADAGGPAVTVEASRLDVHVHENGSARVLARNDLSSADAAWVANNTDAVERALATTETGLDESKHALSVRVDDDLVVVSYVDETFGYRTFGGVVVADAFTRTQTGWEVNTGRLVVHAPGTYVVSTHDGGDTAATWNDSVDAEHVAFAPDHGLVSVATTRLALVAATAPAFLQGAAVALVPFVGALALLFRGVDTAAAHVDELDPRRLGTVTAAGGAVVVLALAATGTLSTYFMLYDALPLFAALSAVAVGALAATGRIRGVRSLALAAVALPLALGAVAAAVGASAHPSVALYTVGRALSAGCLAAQVGVFSVLGATRQRDAGPHRLRRFGAALAPAVAVIALLGPTILLLLWVPALLVLAPAAYVFGATVGRSGLRSV